MTVHRPRAAGKTLLGTRQAAAVLFARHVNTIRRYCQPIACDVETRALLYDLDQAEHTLRRVDRRSGLT